MDSLLRKEKLKCIFVHQKGKKREPETIKGLVSFPSCCLSNSAVVVVII